MISIEKIGAVLGLAAGAVSLAVAALTYQKAHQIGSKVDTAVSDLANKTPVDIKEAIIDKAVQTAVDREVGLAVSLAANTAVKKIAAEMETQIRKPVSESYSNIEKSVATEIAHQVEKLDIEALKRDVTEKAKAAVVKKFDGSLDDILKGFNENLENAAKMYGAIAGSMARKPDKGFVIKFD